MVLQVMVLELLLNPRGARNPTAMDLTLVSFLLVSFSIPVALFIPSLHGTVIIFTLIPSVPIIWSIFFRSEMGSDAADRLKDVKKYSFHYHSPILIVLASYFIGAFLAFAFWSALLPDDSVKQLFGDQLGELKSLRGTSVITGGVFNPTRFKDLFLHNAQVLTLTFLFSLLYGIGALYMILWNASILGVFIGATVSKQGIISAISNVALLLPHGIPEIGAYVIGSAAGAIFSVAVMRRHYEKPEFRFLLLDVVLMVIIALLLLAIGASIEGSR